MTHLLRRVASVAFELALFSSPPKLHGSLDTSSLATTEGVKMGLGPSTKPHPQLRVPISPVRQLPGKA